MKRLQFNVGNINKISKCQKLHIGGNASECIKLFGRNMKIDHTEEILYLGDLIHGSGSNMPNIQSQISRGKRIINDIFYILENACFGYHFF